MNKVFCDTEKELYRYLFKLTSNHYETEDIVQEVYIKFYVFLNKKNNEISEGKIIFYLKKIGKNIVIDKYRRTKVCGYPLLGFEQTDEFENNLLNRLELIDLLKKLNSYQKLIVINRYIVGLSIKQTAKKLNKTEGSIKLTSHRAMKRLNQAIKRAKC